MEALKYPVGRFKIPDTPQSQLITEWIATLKVFPKELEAEVQRFTEAMLDTPYRPDGWTGRQVIHHVADSHMNAYIRFKWALTEDQPTIKPYDEKSWALLPDTAGFEPAGSVALVKALHARWVFLLESMRNEDFQKVFIHPDSGRHLTLFETLGIYAWHCRHHLAHLRLIR